MRTPFFAAAAIALAAPPLVDASRSEARVAPVADTVYVRQALDYDELARHVAARLESQKATRQEPTVIDGDLIVTGRLGVGGAPEPGTEYAVTIRGPGAAAVRFIANEALSDPQREGTQHRHVGTVGVSQDGGLRLDQNSTCFTDERGCTVDDILRRRAYSGFDSVGDMSFYISDIDSTSGRETAPPAQSLVFRLLDWDGNIHIHAHRPGQRIFFNTSTALHAADQQWEVPTR
jgi:hypothetical protein